jgi:biopolymer transport protein ExbB
MTIIDFYTLTLAQTSPPAAGGGGSGGGGGGLWGLFVQSFDFFTILLLLGSVIGVAVIVVCIIEIRAANIVPAALSGRLLDLARAGRWQDVELTVRDDDSLLSRVIRPALALTGRDRAAIRDAAELAASEESARWFRKIDLLSVIGNLGPLVGLAGTVWGMILAFTSLGESGGQAGPADLSLGISKALFHTLLGLCLAIPCLLIYGIYRNIVDRLCTRATVVAAEIVERIPAREDAKP